MKSLSALFLPAVLIAVTACLGGCSTVMGWFGMNGEEDDVVVTDPALSSNEPMQNVRPATPKEIELKIAKLWARVNELELEASHQKQRVKLLERGLLLGIVPEELKHPADQLSGHDQNKVAIGDGALLAKQGETRPKMERPQIVQDQMPSSEPKVDQRQLMIEAQRYFEQGHYGKAIAAYSKIKSSDGSDRYWVALSWARLKEYETAHQHFMDFVTNYANSPWIPRAKFYLAEVNYHMGYREKALEQLRKLIETYPNEDAAQMAKATIKKMENTL